MPYVCILCEDRVPQYSNPGVSLHVFPRCPKKRQTWLNQCGLSNKKISPKYKICSIHFETTCFKYGVKKRVLYPNAVPTIFENGHVETATLPLKIVEGTNAKKCIKNEIVVPNSKSKDISLAKAAKKVVNSQNRKSHAVTPRVVTNEDNDLMRSDLKNQIEEINKIEDCLAKLNKEKSSLESMLDLIKRDQIALNNFLNL